MISPDQIALANETIARHVAEKLDKHYPGHLWAVHADVETGIVKVHNLRCSGQWGFILKIDDIDPDLKCVMRAGGELLERYKLSRGEYKPIETEGRLVNLRGELIHES